ncbi:MAG TPA: hypothetical protein PKJ95_00125 [Atribacterota bacterium]|nr:hypothetical protein [Atribacterota bacterium]
MPTFKEQQEEIIKLKKEIEEKIKTLNEKYREITENLKLGMAYSDLTAEKICVVESIKTKDAQFPYRQLYVSDINGVGLTPIERVYLKEGGKRTW